MAKQTKTKIKNNVKFDTILSNVFASITDSTGDANLKIQEEYNEMREEYLRSIKPKDPEVLETLDLLQAVATKVYWLEINYKGFYPALAKWLQKQEQRKEKYLKEQEENGE